MRPIHKTLLDKLPARKLNKVLKIHLDDMNNYRVNDYTNIIDFMLYCHNRKLKVHLESNHWLKVDPSDIETIRASFIKLSKQDYFVLYNTKLD